MRNVFDQYAQPENRLTHALATSLDRDRWLLRRFLRDFANSVPSDLRNVEVLEQGLPGEPEPAEEEAGHPGGGTVLLAHRVREAGRGGAAGLSERGGPTGDSESGGRYTRT